MKKVVRVTADGDQRLTLVDLGNKRYKITYQKDINTPVQVIYSALHRTQAEKQFLNLSDKILLGTFFFQKPKPVLLRRFEDIKREFDGEQFYIQ